MQALDAGRSEAPSPLADGFCVRTGWSSLGNPGTFAVGAPTPWTADVFDSRAREAFPGGIATRAGGGVRSPLLRGLPVTY